MMDQVVTDSAPTEDLLDVVYDVSSDPSSFQTLTTAFEQWVWPKIQDADNATLERYFASHFERAEGILARISSAIPDTQLSGTFDQFDVFSNETVLLFDKHLNLISGTDAAEQSFSLRPGDPISDLPILQDDIAPLLQHAKNLLDQPQDTHSFLRVRHIDGRQLIVFQIRVVSHDGSTYLAAVSSNVHWPDEYQELLGKAYGLTSAECDIVRLIVDCQSITEIAQRRGRSDGTIRNQVKSIFAKTGARNQAELVRLAMSIMQVASVDDREAIQTALQDGIGKTRLPHVPVHSVTGADGRRLDYLILGDPDGAPVFYLQTELGLTRLPQYVEDNARQRGLRIISPIRAGFGNSDPVPTGSSFAKQVAQDLLTVMDHEGIPSLPVISMAADNGFPAYMHILRPGSVTAVIATSGCFPFVNDDQAARQHPTHRLMHSTARYFPRFLPFVAKACFAFIRKKGKDAIIKLIFKNSPHDLALFENPDVRDAVLEGSNVGLSDDHSAHEAFMLQCLSYHDPEQLTLLPRLKADGVPYHSMNGLKDPSMHADTVAENQERHPWIDFHIYPKAGQWLFFQHPDDVFDLVERYLVK